MAIEISGRDDHGDQPFTGDRGEVLERFSLDPFAGGSYADKPIWTVPQVNANLNRTGYDWYTNNYGELDDGVLNFGFWLNYRELANSYYVNATGSIAFNEAFYRRDFSPFTEGQMMLARDSIRSWDEVVSISFRETKSGNADITYGNTFTGGAQAYAYLPFGDVDDDFYSANYDFDEAGRLSGDVWIDGFVPSNFAPYDDSYYAKLTMIHETGHALGLSHPGDYDALDDDDGDGEPDPITYANDAFYAQDSLQYTVMSYFDAYETGANHIDWSLLNFAYAATPLIHDVAAIQAIYGADTTTRTGDTVYGFNATAGVDAYDFTINARPIVTIWDAGGNDTLDLSGYATGSVIDLNPGSFSSAGGIESFLTLEQVNANRVAAGLPERSQATYDAYVALAEAYGFTNGLFTDNISIAYGVTVENAVGGGGNDTIFTNSVANLIRGGLGSDTVSYATATEGVTASLARGVVGEGGAAGDKLRSIENLWGSVFNDTLTGNRGANVIIGERGNDTLTGGGGRDLFVFDITTSGRDTITDFSKGDMIVTYAALKDADGNGVIELNDDNAIRFGGGNSLTLQGDGASAGLRLAGEVDGLFYYESAMVRPGTMSFDAWTLSTAERSDAGPNPFAGAAARPVTTVDAGSNTGGDALAAPVGVHAFGSDAAMPGVAYNVDMESRLAVDQINMI